MHARRTRACSTNSVVDQRPRVTALAEVPGLKERFAYGACVGSRVHGSLTSLRRATGDDVARLVAWHDDPDVARFWDDERFTADELRERIARPDVEAWIVEADQEPIGYLQVHSTGLDMFLVPSARERSLGPDAARAMTERLLDERGWSRVTVDPYSWNEQALRAWRKAGFVDVSQHPSDGEHTAEWVLMEFRRYYY